MRQSGREVLFYGSNSDLNSASATTTIYMLLCYITGRYNGNLLSYAFSSSTNPWPYYADYWNSLYSVYQLCISSVSEIDNCDTNPFTFIDIYIYVYKWKKMPRRDITIIVIVNELLGISVIFTKQNLSNKGSIRQKINGLLYNIWLCFFRLGVMLI